MSDLIASMARQFQIQPDEFKKTIKRTCNLVRNLRLSLLIAI
jgi:hypothetical protein